MFATLLLCIGLSIVTSQVTDCQTNEELMSYLTTIEEKMEEMSGTIKHLSTQTMMQQFAMEERTRSNGDSGVLLVRGGNDGPQNYYRNTHISGGAFMSIHDHSNYARTIGLGEISAVLNGVEFRTRHNDYKLNMPSTTSTDYRANEPVPFPDVPPAVLEQANVTDQIKEMQAWFKAFKDQDHSVRDYRKYFKPVLCYLEGTWTLDKELEEPFESDRHHLDASSWFELQQNIRYTAYTGTKNRLENFAYLPTNIMSVNDTTGSPNLAQWNYRIMCSPIQQDIPTSYLKQVEDLTFRYPKKRELYQLFYHRAARFNLYEYPSDKYTKYSLIDEIMYNIPGLDNIPGELRESSFGETMFRYDDADVELNTGYYHRWFKFSKPGAMGLTTVARGYSDAKCWVSMTTQKRVAPMALEVCKRGKCQSFNNRFSYAIPLEIIYLTPLLSWNPFDLEQHSKLKIATADGRNGNQNKPLNGTDGAHHYLTPVQFFTGSTDMSDPADTVKNANYVLDKDGVPRVTTASGTKIILQEIAGIGKVRLRYPIAPVYGEGSSVWKELNALRQHVFENGVTGGSGGGGGDTTNGGSDNTDDSLPAIIEFETSPTKKPVDHYHTFSLSKKDYLDLKATPNLEVLVNTSEAASHTHELRIRYNPKRGYEYSRCDSIKVCWDKHPRRVIEIRSSR